MLFALINLVLLALGVRLLYKAALTLWTGEETVWPSLLVGTISICAAILFIIPAIVQLPSEVLAHIRPLQKLASAALIIGWAFIAYDR